MTSHSPLSFPAPLPPSVPVPSTSTSGTGTSSTAPAKPKKPRVGNDAVHLMKAFYEGVSKSPSTVQCRALLEQIHALPGVGNQVFTLDNLRKWFSRYTKIAAQKRASVPADDRNPAYPSLCPVTQRALRAMYNAAAPEARPRLLESWVRSEFYSEMNATQADIRAWLVERIALEAAERTRADAGVDKDVNMDMDIDTDMDGAPPADALRVDTRADAYPYGMPTPSDTTSPEPPYQPYAYHPPTPAASTSASTSASASSRAPSLALKSEPALSPAVPTSPALPYVPTSPVSAPRSVVPLPPVASTSAVPIQPRRTSSAPVLTQSQPAPQPQPEPAPEPSFALRVLEQLKRDMDDEKITPSRNSVPQKLCRI
ncbi:hypothetical protein B0H17DRAFT_346402 [Mycena rosella]|uniref:Uncharacterized protein n=1 Tax=Mycena rosella TaxID=1033263 RepID=A0AAD7G1N8_MYCRO|nr:hypothetical protein B0H17DRAFT_346402 [Mycena rosella]